MDKEISCSLEGSPACVDERTDLRKILPPGPVEDPKKLLQFIGKDGHDYPTLEVLIEADRIWKRSRSEVAFGDDQTASDELIRVIESYSR